jgi:membrane fusion protein, multidrug efflux system
VAQDKAAIQTDEAAVQTAQVNLDYTHIVSPVTGRVGIRMVDPGNYLQPTDTTGIVVITQIDPISVEFTTSEDNLPKIAARLKSGAKLPVTVLDRDNIHSLATGTLTTYDSQIDVTTGTIKMRATFANPEGILFPEQFVNVRLLVDTMTGTTLAPNAAIQLGASGNFVYTLNEDSTVSKRDVTIGPSDGKHTVITSGLKAGDKVVIDGVDRLRDGAKVKIVDNSATTGPQAEAGQQGGEASSAGPANGAGQHHRHHHGQAGAGAGSPAPAATGEAPPPATGAASPAAPSGAATQGAPAAGAAPASPATQGGSVKSPGPVGAAQQGSTR